MGWFSSSTSSNDSNKHTSPPPSSDAFSNLDPSLREFLETESANSPPPPPHHPHPHPDPNTSTKTTPLSPPPPPHSESAYGDRYAHLWKTYQPYSHEASKSEQEKLAEVLRTYRKRKGAAGKAAMENCVVENLRMLECYKGGGMKDKLTNCSEEVKAFDQCYTTQVKFLKALGYMTDPNRPLEVDEQIQMHADRLYQEQLKQDKEAESRIFGRRREPSATEAEEGNVGWWKWWNRPKDDSVPARTKVGNVELVIDVKDEASKV